MKREHIVDSKASFMNRENPSGLWESERWPSKWPVNALHARNYDESLWGNWWASSPNYELQQGFPAFSNTAIDMFGPFQVKIGHKTLKEAHVIIFTCMTTRAIHLELVTDRSTDTFLMAFRRFASLRGHPINCWSDCGTNFVGAQQYLREECKIGISPEFWVSSQINFHAHSSGNGTYHELAIKMEWSKCLFKSVRQALDASSKNQSFTEEQWRTHLAEVTCLVDSRPLYPSSNEIWEGPPVTPNDLLIGHHFPPPAPE